MCKKMDAEKKTNSVGLALVVEAFQKDANTASETRDKELISGALESTVEVDVHFPGEYELSTMEIRRLNAAFIETRFPK
jgi:hypothetical protein